VASLCFFAHDSSHQELRKGKLMLNFSKKKEIKIFLFEKSISENLSISKNQIICSKAAKVLMVLASITRGLSLTLSLFFLLDFFGLFLGLVN
jgi:hypothetical protein